MKSLLMKIQDTVIKYADIISKISTIDVEVVDENLFRVAGTGLFKDKVNRDMSAEGYVYRKVLQTGRREIIYNPRKEHICLSCPFCQKCREEIEFSMPIQFDDKIIGVIGLVGSNKEQKTRILQDEKLYIDFIEQIADFISTKAKEMVEIENKNAIIHTLDCTIEHIEHGVMIIDHDNRIVNANTAAMQQLEIEKMEGLVVEIQATGDHMNNSNEYRVRIAGREFFIMGNKYELGNASKQYSEVVLFDSRKNVQKKYYEMTSTVHTQKCSNIVGNSAQTQALKQKIVQVAKSTSTVLITGESGTGKELVATAIWDASDRWDKRFVAINCAAIPEALLESELFGYVKGAFTGADPNGRIGKFELANKGVIFLDEIGDMPLYLQVKLLRVLQERKITRIGSNQVQPLDVRIIAATNKNLKEMIKENRFREDLYYRLNVIPMEIAPLRERKEDIEMLAVHFANHYAKLFNKYFYKMSDSVRRCLESYPWEGNVRELENVMEFMINMMKDDGILDEDTLPRELSESKAEPALVQEVQDSTELVQDAQMEIVPLREIEAREIAKAIRLYGNTTEGKKRAAKSLGIGLATLYRRLEENALLNSQIENK